jgi:hypothetical protein
MRVGLFALLLLTVLAAPPRALAQGSGGVKEADMGKLRTLYEFGKFEEALGKALALIPVERGRDKPNEETLIELYKYAGAAAFNLGKAAEAEPQFLALLQIDPDFVLDPFIYPPPAVNFLEKLKRDNVKILDSIRETRREQRKREAEEREEKRRKEQEEARRRLDLLSHTTTIRTVEKHSFALNFVPFGAGQFQQKRNTMGVLLASSEGALAITSIIAYLALNSLIEEQTITIDGRLAAPGSSDKVAFTVRGIPRNRASEANVWRLVKVASGAAFYTVYAYGVVDAVYHHEDEVVSSSTSQRGSSPAKETTGPVGIGTDALVGSNLTEPSPDLGPRFFFFPVPGDGLGAGLTLTF